MRVLFISDVPMNGLGGSETVIREQIKIALEKGYEVYLIQFGNKGFDSYPDTRVKVSTFNPTELLHIEWHPEYPDSISNLARICLGFYDPLGGKVLVSLVSKINPDLIHFSCVNSPAYIGALKKLKVPLVVNFPGYIFQCPKGGLLRKSGTVCSTPPLFCQLRNRTLERTLLLPNRIVAQSNFMRELLINAGYAEEKIKLIYNPIHVPDNIQRKDAWSNSIVFAGRLTDYKGILDAIEAVLTFDKKDIKLIICGDGPLKDQVVKLCSHHPDRLIYKGRLQQKELFQVYLHADAIIIPSRSPESFCIVGGEALGFGLPILGTPLGALSELVINGETGYQFNPGDISSISASLTKLYSDWKSYSNMTLQAQAHAKKFSIEAHSTGLQNLYEELLSHD